MNKTIIITSYMENSDNFSHFATPADYIICTDGGYDIALKYNLKPDLLLGDFDSITAPLPNDVETIKFNPEKDFTDLDLALKHAAEISNSSVEIWGGLGGRFDHTMANIQLLSCYCDKFSNLTIMDGRNKCMCVNASDEQIIKIHAEDRTYISLFALSEMVTISSSGVKYPLDGYILKRTFPLGVSNEFTSEEAIIKIENGTLLIVLSKM